LVDRAKSLAQWINDKTNEMKDHNWEQSVAGVKQALADLADHRQNQKPPKAGEKLDLEALFNNIQLKLRSNNRPAFQPAEGTSIHSNPCNCGVGTSPSDLQAIWDALNAAERDREDALRRELER
jgi:hypothetical protein